MSDVEVSLSTLMHEVEVLARASAACRKAGATAASVKMNPSIVAMSGAIMPEPLMMPVSVMRVCPIIAAVVAAFAKVSVVPMALVAAQKLPLPSAAWAAATPDTALSCGKGTPMTPVEAANTSSAAQPSSAAAALVCAAAASRPDSPVKALELPALTTSPRARPPGNRVRAWPRPCGPTASP